MKPLFAAVLALAALPAAGQDAPAPAAEPPRIVEIVFEGNTHTTVRTMERELTVHVGDAADPAAIERSRQAVQDLTLFRVVYAVTEPAPGGVRLRFIVEEKYFLIPAPRADANSDGKYAYGVQLRWYNVFGLNHTMKITWKKVNRAEAGRGTGTDFDTSYVAPFIFDSPYGLDLAYSHSREPVTLPPAPYLPYDEVKDSERFVVTRAFPGDLPPSQGWRLGAGVALSRQDTAGPVAPPSYGHASALVLNASYSDVRFNIFSEAGQRGGIEWAGATESVASDYGYNLVTGNYLGSWYVGDAEHQTVEVFAEGGWYRGGGPGQTGVFELGGAEDLRGFRHGVLRGNGYYYAGVEYLRPLFWRSVRGVAFAESGRTYMDDNIADVGTCNDVGLGLRIRFSRFVKFEANVGVAYALTDTGDSRMRFFFTGRR